MLGALPIPLSLSLDPRIDTTDEDTTMYDGLMMECCTEEQQAGLVGMAGKEERLWLQNCSAVFERLVDLQCCFD